MPNDSFRRWLRRKFVSPVVRPIRTRTAPARRPAFEQLEDRITPAPLQFFFVPMPETATNDAFDAIVSQSVDSTEVSITAITVTENNTTIWYDHWEDGYETKLGSPAQSTTRVWGDGIDANGIAPGFAKDPAGLASGTVIRLRNDVATPRNLATQPILFDSPDRFATDRTVAVSRVQFPTLVNAAGGSVISSAVEVRDTRFYDTKFTAPVGKNTADSGTMFSYAAFFVQASLDNTRVQIDANNDGNFTGPDDRDVVLNQGETVVSGQNVLQGGRVVADRPVQVDLMTGQINGMYASRTYALFSDAQLANDYFTPVGFNSAVDGTNDDVRLYVYNPNAKSIDVRQESNAGIVTTKTIAAGSSTYFDVLTNTGTRLFSVLGEVFAAAGTHDQQGVTHDWGFSLQPVPALSQIAIVGLGIGNSNDPPSGGTGAGNFSPVFVTALGNTTLQIDHDNDGSIDQTVAVSRLQTVRLRDITDGDNDNSGMKIFTLDGTLISVTWGEDGTAPDGSPGLDAGTTIPAIPVPEYFKFSDFAPGGDVNGDGLFNEGDTVRYSLRIRHLGTTPISNAVVTDFLPASQVTYQVNSTRINFGSSNDPILDDGVGTAFPLDGAGYNVTNIAAGQTVTLSFDAKINTGLPAGYNDILNLSVLAYDIFRLPANDVIDLRGTVGDRVWYDVDGDGAQDAGEPGVVGATVTLTWFGPDGAAGGGDDDTFTTTTGTDGIWTVTNSPAGNYGTAVSNLPFGLSSKTFGPATFSLAAGQVNRTDIDFGYQGAGSLSGSVYIDANNDGTRQIGEAGISSATVTIAGTDAAGVSVNRTATTAADGSYSFAGLLAGTFTITETQPVGFLDGKDKGGTAGGTLANDQVSAIALGNGASGTGYTFGELQPASISGVAFRDDDNNGTQNGAEPGIGGVSIALTGTDDLGNPVSLSKTTAADGTYSFAGLRPGTYKLVETQPSGFLDGKDATGTAGGTLANDQVSAITLASNTSATGYTFGELVASSLSGIVFRDDDNNGIQNGAEPGIGSVTIALTGTDDLGSPVNLSKTTAADGSYSFAGLRPGTYKLVESQPVGFLDGKDAAGSAGGTLANDQVSAIALASNTSATGYTFGELLATSISGVAFRDDDNNGTQNGAEPGIGGVTIALSGTDDLGSPVSLSKVTAGDGSYSFAGLRPGTYKLVETQPAGFLDGKDSVGTAGGTLANDQVSNIVLPSNTSATGYTFGELRPANLSGVVFRDDDNNGAQNGAEPGIGGVSIALTGTDDLGNPVSLSKSTAADGSYSFVGLRPGTYQLVETQPAAYSDGTDAVGTAGGTAGNDTLSGIVLVEGAAATGYTFGERAAGLSGTVFIDANRDGTIQSGDAGRGGATVTLTDGTNTFTTTTAADGSYSFANLPAGNYTATLTTPGGFGTSTPTAKSIALTPAGSTGNDFGITASTLAGIVFRDDDNGGTQNGVEPGLGGVTVTLTDSAGNPAVDAYGNVVGPAVTLTDGSYSFAGLVAGDYRVIETQPAQYGQGTNAVGTFGGSKSVDTFAIAVPAGQDGTGYNFGERGGTVAGSVYRDADNGGTRGAGEPGIGGVTVQLRDGTGTVVATATTAGDGTYSFIGLLPDTYSVLEVTQPAGLLDGRETRGNAAALAGTVGTDTVSGIVVAAGQTTIGNNFGELDPASIGDFVWEDLNGNGRQDAGEPGLAGVTVTLTGTDDLGAVMKTATTDSKGLYGFGDLRPGTYQVAIAAPVGFNFSRLNSAVATAATDSDINPATGKTAASALAVGQSDSERDAGLYRPVSIGDLVWLNTNGDSVRDAGEPGLPGVTVELTEFGPNGVLGGGDDVVTTATTKADGTYTFDGLAPGSFRVRVTGGVPGGATANFDADGGNDSSTNLALASGQTTTAVDFGFAASGMVAGIVWQDLDGNGNQPAGEPGIPNVTVRLREAGPDGNFNTADDLLYPSTVTGPNGGYSFTGLPAGNYRADVDTATLPPNALATFDRDGGNDSTTVVALPANGSIVDVSFGYRGTGSIGDRVWNDRDGNGLQDANEPGLPGAIVRLQAAGADGSLGTADDLFYAPQTTTAGGGYSFANLLTGTYRVVVDPASLPGGLTVTGDPQGAFDGTADVTLTAVSPTTSTIDFGYRGIGTVGDRLWYDIDADGIQDAGEPGSNGVAVALTWAGPNGAFGDADDVAYGTVTTSGDGDYSFAGLPLGSYSVAVLGGLPAGLATPTFDADGTSTANVATVALTVGSPSLSNVDFGYRGTGSVGDRIWNDRDGDGVQEANEPGLAGLPVTLDWFGPDGVPGGGDDVSFATTTGPDGIYTFTNLPAGEFSLAVGGLPANFTPTTATHGALTLADGQTRLDLDFGYRGDATIGDLVWYDVDADGTQNNAEPGLAGVGLTVLWFGADNAEGTADDTSYTAITGADGIWSLAGLPQGSFRASVVPGTLPIGFAARTADLDGTGTADTALFPLAGGQSRTDLDFGYRGTGLIAGLATEDLNGTATREAGEPALGTLAVRLLDAAGNVLATTTTAPDGSYSFPGLAPGGYRVEFVAPNGYTFAPADLGGDDTRDSDADPATGQSATVALANGASIVDLDAGLYRLSSLGGIAFEDANGDGIQTPGETPFEGVTVTLYDATGTPVGSTVTAPDGKYGFANLVPGNYTVEFGQPAGTAFTAVDQGGNDGADSDADPATGKTATVAVISGTPAAGVDAGLYRPAALGDRVWLDQNGDGVQQSNEPGLAGVTVTGVWAGPDGTFGTKDDVTLTPAMTGSDGTYQFANLAPGQYRVAADPATLPAGATTATFDADGTATPNAATVAVVSGQTRTDVDFGTRGTGSLGDRVWYDANANGNQDAGEPGLVGAAVSLTWAGADGDLATTGDNLTLAATTDANGLYSFGSLPAGTYRIAVDPATIGAGLAPNFDLDGTATPHAATVALAVAQARTDLDFGYAGVGLISGQVFVDANADGTATAGETGLGGTTVTLTGTDLFGNPVNLTTTTNPDGTYSFPNLAPGTYSVTESQPTGYGSSTPNAVPVTLAPGGTATVNFGETLGSLGGTVYVDQNANGTFDAGDAGLGGVTVTLAGTDALGNPVTRTTTSAADGSYNFTGLLAGTFTITETQPTGVYDGLDAVGTAGGNLADPLGDNVIRTIPLAGGAAGTGYLFGEFPPAGVFGFVYEDANANGIRETGEPGIAGVTVTIAGTAFAGTAAERPLVPSDLPGGSLTVATDANGRWAFGTLPPGQYTFTAGTPAGYLDGNEENADANPAAGPVVGDDRFDAVTLTSAVRGPLNFGEFLPGRAAGTVIMDRNGDGLQDANDAGIAGVTVTLVGTDDRGQQVTRTTVTAPDGSYEIGGLRPGNYSVTFTPPSTLVVVGRRRIEGVTILPNGLVGNLVFAVRPLPRNVPLVPVNPQVLPPSLVQIGGPNDLTKRSFLSSTPEPVATAPDMSALPRSPQFLNAAARVGRTDGSTAPIVIATGADAGRPPEVRVFDYATGLETVRFLAYESTFTGGVRVAVADVDGDGIDEIITAPGVGGGPLVRVFDLTGRQLNQILAYAEDYRGGLWVAAGDTDGDGDAEIVTGADVGGGPHVRLIDGQTGAGLANWFAYDPAFRGGVRVAAGDTDGDGRAEVITAAGIGGGPDIRTFDGTGQFVRNFMAYDPTWRGGMFVATGDLDGDGIAEILTGAGAGGGPHVRAFHGTTQVEVASFFAFDAANRNGVRVAAEDLNADGRDDILVGSGIGGGSEVRVFNWQTGELMDDFFADDPLARGGVFVG